MTTTTDIQIKSNMDAMYRWTRHIYDITRKYYLLGRDQLISNLNAKADEHVCEVGCGTARNLIKMAQHYPGVHFYGLDASDEMLKTAKPNVDRAGYTIPLAQGYSQNFAPKDLFNLDQAFNKIVFSYALSIIPPWKDSIDHALELLPSGGEMHIVDFGSMDKQPALFRGLIFWWLSVFHVYHKPEILDHLQKLVTDGHGTLNIQHLYNGYAYIAVFKKT